MRDHPLLAFSALLTQIVSCLLACLPVYFIPFIVLCIVHHRYCGGIEPGGTSYLCCQPSAPIGNPLTKACCPVDKPIACGDDCCALGYYCKGNACTKDP